MVEPPQTSQILAFYPYIYIYFSKEIWLALQTLHIFCMTLINWFNFIFIIILATHS